METTVNPNVTTESTSMDDKVPHRDSNITNSNHNNNNFKNSLVNGVLHESKVLEMMTKSKDDLEISADEKAMEEDEEGDEPDAMSTGKQHLDHMKVASQEKEYNGYSESGEEDLEEDDRLVIDDQDARSLSKSTNVMEQIFSCPQCHVVTTSAKAYLYHLDNVHNVKESGRRVNLLASEEDDRASSKTPDSSNGFLNLSIPLEGQQAFSSLKEEDMDEEEEESSMNTTPSFALTPKSLGSSLSIGITTENIDQMFDDDKKKKKKTRQEVDPGKYFEAVDSSGTKYACSQCGNIYKWRKSLNKHWKEKHLNDPLAEVASPPGMLELLKSGKYTQLGSRRIYDNNFLQTIKAQKDDDFSRTSTPNSDIKSSTPTNFVDTSSQVLNASDIGLSSSLPTSILPKMIGPFVANTAQPVFPGMGMALQHIALRNGFDSTSDEGALDLTRAGKAIGFPSFLAPTIPDMNSSFDQDQPLDFSKKKDMESAVKVENVSDEATQGDAQRIGMDKFMSKIHRCSKCDYTSTSEIDFANHAGSHYSKRVSKCFECKLQFNSMEELNVHYVRDHTKKLTEYKEAIKKIPHGLQQTYHLLKMDLQSIGELNNQDLGSSDSKSLKCKKCDFEAKWPAELQKHAVSHSEERPYICMVCGSTYKWKWDLVKHFQKSHPALPNPYRRNDKRETPDVSSEEEMEDEPDMKRAKMSGASTELNTSGLYNGDDIISVKGIIEATQAGQRFVSSQPNLFDEDSSIEGSLALMQSYPYAVASSTPVSLAQELVERHTKAQKAIQDAIKNRQTTPNTKSPSSNCDQSLSNSPVPMTSNKAEQLPYKCTMCNYHARWPSEVTQHMKNHSDCKPYLCPRCDYRSKWKWDVVKHLKRCGGGTINDVIDITKMKKKDVSPNSVTSISSGPPNAVVSQQGKVKKMTPQPLSFILPSLDANGQQSALVVKSTALESTPSSSHTHIVIPEKDLSSNEKSINKPSNASPNSSGLIDLMANNNNNDDTVDNNVNNNYAAYCDGQPATPSNPLSLVSMASAEQNSVVSSVSPSSASVTSSPVASSYRQNSTAEIWNCPHCPFSTQSQAELKRHSGLHMDDKPFKCNECHYSTRWACDLKKHRKSYDHYPKNNNNNNSNLINKNSKEVSVNKVQSKSKGDKEDDNGKVENKGRFKCFQCSTFFISLQSLIDHRRNSHSPDESSPAPQTSSPNEIDVARIKHPRKQIKQFTCPKCPFICKNRQTMDKHIEEHEQMERDAFQCFYCSSQYKDKEALLDHIVTHPAFTAKEWETFFMITEEEEHSGGEEKMDQSDGKAGLDVNENLQMSNKSPAAGKEDQTKLDAEAATQARIQQILDEIPKQKNMEQQAQQQKQHVAVNKFKCEWCPAEFINLTSVYNHASIAHPVQLKEQDVNMSLAYVHLPNKSIEAQRAISNKTELPSAEALQNLKQQIAEKRNHQLAEKINHMVSNNPKLQQVLNKRLEDDSMTGPKKFQCDKCTFSTSSHTTFQNHCELHGGKVTSQCWFCEFTVDKMELLYQHMKISHTRKWKALSQDPKYANQIQRMNLAFSNTRLSSPPLQGMNSDASFNSNSSDAGAMDLTSKKSATEFGHDIVYIRKPQYTWSGIPVNVIPDGTALNFVCPKCSFNDASIAKTCAHVMQSHRAMSKFNCTRCQFSDDNIHVMSDHCKTCHPVQERIVEVLDFKQLNFTELQMVQLSAMKEKMPQDLRKDNNDNGITKFSHSGNEHSSPPKSLSCPFCPFKTAVKEIMKQHIGNHGQNSKFSCQSCDFSSDSPVIMADHVRVHEKDYDGENKNSENTVKIVKQGKDTETIKEEPSIVQIAEREHREHRQIDTTQTGSLSTDAAKVSSPKAKTLGRIRYRCSICPYHTTCKSNIFKHKRQHIIPKRYKCTKCSYTAARAVLLKKHIESHSVPIGDEDGYYHDIFYDPYSAFNEKIEDNEEAGENEEVEAEDASEEDSTSDDLDNEMNSKAIADLEAKDILEAEATHKVSSLLMDESDPNGDKQQRKQKCSHCPFSSNSSYEFRKHLNFHGTQERYKCDHCTYSIDRFNLLTQHRKLHVNNPGYSSNPVPSDLLNTSFILQQNEMMAESVEEDKEESSAENESENPESQYSCSVCPYRVSNKKLFDIHCQGHGQRKRFICDFCDWSADRIPLLHQHRKIHEKEPTYNPSPTDNIFLNQEFDDGAAGEFESKFMEIHNPDKQSKEGENEVHNSPPFKLTVMKKNYPCKLCPYKTNSKNNYHIHKSMHLSGGDYSCSECTFSAISQGLLQQHKLLHSSSSESLSHHGNGPVNSSSSSVSDLKPETSQPEHVWQKHPHSATSPSSLSNHLKGHEAPDALTCPFCDFSATSQLAMYPHIQIHFPDTKLGEETISRLLEEHAGKDSKLDSNSEKPADLGRPSDSVASPSDSQVIKTKIYVCQYCEREFEAKSLMIQHEKQHLAGNH